MTVQDTKLVIIILEDIKRMVKEKDPKVIDAIDACIRRLESR